MYSFSKFNKFKFEWEKEEGNRWIKNLIPDLHTWLDRGHGSIDHYVTQFLSGLGAFGHYLHRFKSRHTPKCFCNKKIDDTPKHTFFKCTTNLAVRLKLGRTYAYINTFYFQRQQGLPLPKWADDVYPNKIYSFTNLKSLHQRQSSTMIKLSSGADQLLLNACLNNA